MTEPNPFPKAVFYKDDASEWRWKVVAANGHILADSGEGYKNKEDCIAGYWKVQNQ